MAASARAMAAAAAAVAAAAAARLAVAVRQQPSQQEGSCTSTQGWGDLGIRLLVKLGWKVRRG